MASGPIASWLIDGESMETVTDFIFLGSKTTADGDCSHEIKRHLLLAWKAMIDLDSMLKSRDITLLTRVRLVKAMVFPVVMYGWLWELGCKIKLSTEELMLLNCGVGEDSWESLGQQDFQPAHPKGNQSWIFTARTYAEAETLTPTWWTWVWVSSGIWWWTWKPGMLQSMRSQRVGHSWATELNWIKMVKEIFGQNYKQRIKGSEYRQEATTPWLFVVFTFFLSSPFIFSLYFATSPFIPFKKNGFVYMKLLTDSL